MLFKKKKKKTKKDRYNKGIYKKRIKTSINHIIGREYIPVISRIILFHARFV